MKRYRVNHKRVPESINPISVSANEKVVCLQESNPDGPWANWVLCQTKDNEGWVPKQIIKRNGSQGVILVDYDAIEFILDIDEVVVMEKELNGWIWCWKETEPNVKAWAPLNHLIELTS